MAGTETSFVHGDSLEGVRDPESLAQQQLLKEKVFYDLPRPAVLVSAEALRVLVAKKREPPPLIIN